MSGIRVSFCWMHFIGGEINACWRGSRVFVPGPGGAVVGPSDWFCAPPKMAALGGQEGGDQEAFGSGLGGDC